jgi:protein LTV1
VYNFLVCIYLQVCLKNQYLDSQEQSTFNLCTDLNEILLFMILTLVSMSSRLSCERMTKRYANDHSIRIIFPVLNQFQGKTRADLESLLSPDDITHDTRANVGEAALYDIYYDDTEYDYMQHLRTVGAEEEGVESILIEAPAPATSQKSKGKGKSKDPISLRDDLPPEALPSASEMPRTYESQEAIPSSIAGFQPDMDPHLRQVLEALEDDAFVDDGLEDNFFGELVAEGERGQDEEFEYQFYDDGDTPKDDALSAEDPSSWEASFAKFKKDQKEAPPPSDSDDDLYSEGGDTIGNLPKLPVIGGKRRRKGTSDASGYSMSSSSMTRTETLMTLDERFDQVIVIGSARLNLFFTTCS